MINEYKKAERFYQEAINLAPGWLTPYYGLGQLYRYRGNLEKAEATVSGALEIALLDQQTLDLLGWINLQAGDLVEAAEYWSRYEAIEKQFTDSTQYIPFRHRLGYVLALQGDTVTAVKLIEEQCRLDKERFKNIHGYGVWGSGYFYYDLAASNAWLGNKEEALAWFDSSSQKGFMNSWYLENDPLLDNIRNTAGFREIKKNFSERLQAEINAFKNTIESNKSLQQELERLPLNSGQDL